MHENLGLLEGLDVNTYIISSDTPEEQYELYRALEEKFGESLPFVSDPDLKLIDKLHMKNGDMAFRGYALLDNDGRVIFQKVNDHWAEELTETMEVITKELENRK
ncbi:hypothetical protein DS745_03645 [Anaerobacillus alkaliphilus]|uniref:Alkyl hydroperoxide reductase subunit C/ Thiol specific antioxidant domain-containing protein n=1 Tax=Anaerobacillus alkaliphilus TaxID=1548597 RepID=A0A4Q0VXL9_9BACI|nr:hypothetical protein DS745_03645 [Anaerobacillus alkaliphilus]